MTRELEWTPELVTRFWDVMARERPDTFFTYRYGGAIARAAKPYLSARARVIDFGCGTGSLIPHLLAEGWSVQGTDLSTAAIEGVNDTYRDRERFLGASKLDEIGAGGFDGAFAVELVEHLEQVELAKALENLHALLRPAGSLIVTTPNDEDLATETIYCPVSDVWFHRWQHVRSWTGSSLALELGQNGFAVHAVFETNFSVAPPGFLTRLHLRANALLGRRGKAPHLMVVASRTA